MRARPPRLAESPPDFSLSELAEAVNLWCTESRITPANGQVGQALTERSIRFYRTVGLVDGPIAGGGRGYAEKHLLQLIAIRVLQAQGLPLRRIRELLLGRSLKDLREIRERSRSEATTLQSRSPTPVTFIPGEPWQLLPLTADAALLLKSAVTLTPQQFQEIQSILHSVPAPAQNNGRPSYNH